MTNFIRLDNVAVYIFHKAVDDLNDCCVNKLRNEDMALASEYMLKLSLGGLLYQKHLSPTYLSAVHVTAVKTTYFIESVYSKLRLS